MTRYDVTSHFMMFPKGQKVKSLYILTSEIKSWLNFGLETYMMEFFRHLYLPKKFAWKKIKKEYPVFWLFLKISNIDLGPLKSKFFKSENSTYSENVKSFALKLWFLRTNSILFWDTLNNYVPAIIVWFNSLIKIKTSRSQVTVWIESFKI